MKILIAPDKFKGSMTAQAVCLAIQKGIRQFHPGIETVLHPLADGGEGTLEVLGSSLDLETVTLTVSDPLFRPVQAFYKKNRETAFIEMAVASGLELLSQEERNCLDTTTFGTGELMLDAIHRGVKKIFLFIGGSATNDAGTGMAAALGYRFLDENGQPLSPIGKELVRLKFIDQIKLKFNPADLEVNVVCDVKNVLFGKNGAAHVFAPQKGADETAVELLDKGLVRFGKTVFEQLQKDVAFIEGGGAAGGLGAGAVAFLNARILPGIQTIMEVSGFEKHLPGTDLIITGEGKLDEQTMKGKVIKGVCEVAAANQIPVAAICGTLAASPDDIGRLGLVQVAAIKTEGVSLQQAITEAAARIENLAFEMVRTLHIQNTFSHNNTNEMTETSIFQKTKNALVAEGFRIDSEDFHRPWGGFLVIDERQAPRFIEKYFPGFDDADLIGGRKVSPKILLVAPQKRLSWQYHHRRSEVWTVVEGIAGIIRSNTDAEGSLERFKKGDTITLARGERHRLVGLEDWGMIAEIWQHTDPGHPSSEDDIVRLQDDFGRKSPVGG